MTNLQVLNNLLLMVIAYGLCIPAAFFVVEIFEEHSKLFRTVGVITIIICVYASYRVMRYSILDY